MKNFIKNTFNSFVLFIKKLRRPSGKTNTRLLQQRGETIDSFIIREAIPDDVPALAALHVKTWSETYNGGGPGQQIRQHQWTELFKNAGNKWFVLVLENKNRELIGFAHGHPYDHPDLPEFNGQLNKIYLLRDYQRLRLGRKLFLQAVKKLLDNGATNMVLFGTPQNPSCAFYEAMGGEKLHKKGEVFQGGYCWRDLTTCLTNV
jgi:ribosomal protein S18 acetylase RimI-like enzyme